jgi:hypothetical protein
MAALNKPSGSVRMWTETTEGRKYVHEISKKVVSRVAPEEVDLFEELLQQYFDNPHASALDSKAGDDPLGSGLAEPLLAATPAAAAMASAVIGFLVNEVMKAAQKETATMIKEKIPGLFVPDKKTGGSPPVTKEQLDQIKNLARNQANLFGFTAENAEKMTNALIESLTLL